MDISRAKHAFVTGSALLKRSAQVTIADNRSGIDQF
jgi:hypothetical protein